MFCIAGLLKIWEAFWDDFTVKPIFDTKKKTTSKQLWTILTNSLKIYIKAAKLIRRRVFVWLIKVAMWRTTQSKGLAFNQEKPLMSKSNNFFLTHIHFKACWANTLTLDVLRIIETPVLFIKNTAINKIDKFFGANAKMEAEAIFPKIVQKVSGVSCSNFQKLADNKVFVHCSKLKSLRIDQHSELWTNKNFHYFSTFFFSLLLFTPCCFSYWLF